MSHPKADAFIAALRAAESSGDPAPLAQLYADDSECTNLAKETPETGVDGARKFWADYLYCVPYLCCSSRSGGKRLSRFQW